MAIREQRSSFAQRMWRAAKLEASLYDEVKADEDATGQALGVVVLASLAGGIGTRSGMGTIVVRLIFNIGFWYLAALLIYWLGTKVFPEPRTESDVGGVLRAIGFSSAPGLIFILGIVSGLKMLVLLVGFLWVFAADVIAVRQALNYRSTGRAFGVYFVVFLVLLLVDFVLESWFGIFPEPM